VEKAKQRSSTISAGPKIKRNSVINEMDEDEYNSEEEKEPAAALDEKLEEVVE
jgi:hypothetical protein